MNQIVRALPSPALLSRGGVEIVALGDIAACGREWDALLAGALDPNPHCSRHVVEAHARAGLAPADLPLLVARRGVRWLALLPLAPRTISVGFVSRAQASWTSPFVTLGTPLLAREAAEEAAEALLDGLASLPVRFALLRALPLNGAAAAALGAALDRRGWPQAGVGAFDRAVLDRRGLERREPGDLQSAGRRKDLRRRRLKLASLGIVEHRSATEGAALREAVDAFLALEARGWKGARGTALASRPETAAFARALFATDGGPVTPRADLLTLDRRPIAASLGLVCAGTAYLLKTAYDETLRRFAPGLLLEEDIIRCCLRTGFAERLDSAAREGHVLGEFFPGRERVGDLLFAPSAARRSDFPRVVAREERRRRWLGEAKAVVNGWRDRLESAQARGR